MKIGDPFVEIGVERFGRLDFNGDYFAIVFDDQINFIAMVIAVKEKVRGLPLVQHLLEQLNDYQILISGKQRRASVDLPDCRGPKTVTTGNSRAHLRTSAIIARLTMRESIGDFCTIVKYNLRSVQKRFPPAILLFRSRGELPY
jgi:hypothetical protein